MRSTTSSRKDDLIFDVGMDVGEDTRFYLAKGFRVVAVEANPAVCAEVAERNAAAISQGRLSIINRAISERGDPLLFYVCRTNSAWSTASIRLRDYWRSHYGAVFTEIEVDGVTTPDLMEDFGVPYYAKIDIEGFDLECLGGFASAETRPNFISIEVDFRRVDELLGCATALGYSRFALVGQRTVPEQKQPLPAREGLAADHPFTLSSSGLFGRELPAAWGDQQSVRAQCRTIIRQYRANALLQRCARVLPKRAVASFQSHHLPLACDWYDIHAAL